MHSVKQKKNQRQNRYSSKHECYLRRKCRSTYVVVKMKNQPFFAKEQFFHDMHPFYAILDKNSFHNLRFKTLEVRKGGERAK